MRVTAERLLPREDILFRLLTDTSPVQIGTYSITAAPFAAPLTYDVLQEFVVSGEARLTISILNVEPDFFLVTLPDSTTQTVWLAVMPQVNESLLASQPDDAVLVKERPDQQPAHGNSTIAVMAPPELPPTWFALDFRTPGVFSSPSPVKNNALTYMGGGLGRALSSNIAQRGFNDAPWLLGAPLQFEGAFTNVIPSGTFSPTTRTSAFLDPVPNGWEFEMDHPDSMLRLRVLNEGVLPSLQLVYQRRAYVHSNFDLISLPGVRITAPIVPANTSFQVIVVPDAENGTGSVELRSNNGAHSTGRVPLVGVTTLRLNVLLDAGPVQILWWQDRASDVAQSIKLVAPAATTYGSPHTWAPTGQVKQTDSVIVGSIEFEQNWFFTSGNLRVASANANPVQPLGWEIRSTLGQSILRLQAGQLSSIFSAATPVNLVPFLAAAEESGNYRIDWRPGQPLKIFHRLAPSGVVLPMTMDLPFTPVVQAPLLVEFSPFSPSAGSSTLLHFSFAPF